MKKIGFIDYYLSEWHANHYPAWIKEACSGRGEDFTLSYAWGEIVSPKDGKTSAEWCAEYGAENCGSIEEVCERSDAIFLLAPSDPEKHLEYAERILKFGKPVYIDKTFAPDLATARRIFAAGESGGAPFFSTSALRYATEIGDLHGVSSIMTTGGGSSLQEYCIHQIEMIVKVMRASPLRLKVESAGEKQYLAIVDFDCGKRAAMMYSPEMPFSVCANMDDGSSVYREITSDYFKILIGKILDFFSDGILPFDKQQTLDAMNIREKILCGADKNGEWISLQ